jgi:hypothetical protein
MDILLRWILISQFDKAWPGTEYHPVILSVEFRILDLENASRQHGFTLSQVAGRQASVPILQKTSIVLRAHAYNRRLFREFNKATQLLVR